MTDLSMTDVAPGEPLQAAVDALAAGDVLRLAAGEYALDAPLRLRRGVRIVGAGAAATRIVRPRAPHAHLADAHVPAGETLTLEGLTLTWAEGDDDRPGAYLFGSDALVVTGGRVVLRGCRLAGSAAEHAKVGDMYGGAGLRVVGEAEVRAENSEIEGHGGHGVLVGERATVALAACWVAGNRGMGLLAIGEATVEARATTFTENARGGVTAADAAAIGLVEVEVQGNRRFGVRLETGASTRLAACTIAANGGPGVVAAAGALALVGGAVRGNGGDGVAVAAGIHADLSDVVIAENRGYGVALAPGATADLARAAIHGNGRGGVEGQGG